MNFRKPSRAFRIPLIYGTFSVIWIVVTDRINFLIAPNFHYATLIAIAKGLFFVFFSTSLLYFLLKIDEKQERSLRSELQTMQDSFSRLFANNPIPMWVNDPDNFRFLVVNEAACKLFGYSQENFLNLRLDVLCTESDREQVLLAAGKHFEGIQTTGPWKQIDGQGREILVNLVFVRFEFAGRAALLVTCVDLSKQQEMEESLRRTTNERDAFETFSYSISHDLRANLRAVSGYSQLLLEDYADKLDAQAQDYLTKLQAAGEQMNRTINNMLMLSQLSHASLNPGWINLSDLAGKIVANLQSSEPARKASFKIPPDLFAMADPELMEVAFNNLFENAWKYTARRDETEIELGCLEPKGDEKVYFIRDNGVGFDVKKAGELFKPFQRFHPQSDFPGSGIGLSIVSRIIQIHNGRIWAESEPDRGATFFFSLNFTS